MFWTLRCFNPTIKRLKRRQSHDGDYNDLDDDDDDEVEVRIPWRALTHAFQLRGMDMLSINVASQLTNIYQHHHNAPICINMPRHSLNLRLSNWKFVRDAVIRLFGPKKNIFYGGPTLTWKFLKFVPFFTTSIILTTHQPRPNIINNTIHGFSSFHNERFFFQVNRDKMAEGIDK